MKLKVLFAGIDGSGKSSCLDALISRLEPELRVLKIGVESPCLCYRGQKEELINPKWYVRIGRLRERSIRYHVHGIFLIFNFLYKFLCAKYFAAFHKTDVVVFESDTLLHPAVYITYHFPFSKLLSASWRLRLVHLLFGSTQDVVIFYLDTDPELAVERIDRRGIEIQPHENMQDLTVLRAEFEQVLSAASARGYDILRIDTGAAGPVQAADQAEASVRERLAADS